MLPQQPRRSARKQARNQLQAIMTDSSKRFCSDNKSGEFELPPALLEKVMSCLAVMEADGVRGPSMAARDLANASLVSSDFFNASKHGFAALEQQAAELKLRCGWEFSKPASVQCSNETLMSLQSLPRPTSWSWQQWAACLQDPLQYRVYELKQAAKQLAVPGNSSKLVTGILQAFGLQQPSSVAPQLLRAVLLERCCACPWAGCEQVSSVWDALKEWSSSDIDRKWPGLSKQLSASSCSTAAARRRALLMYTGACSKQQLQGLLFLALQKDDFSEWLRKDVQKAVEKQRKQMQVLVEVMPQFFQNMRAMIQQHEQQQEQIDTAMQQVQKLADVFDTLQQLLQEVPQRVARMRKQHQELPRMTGKQLQPLLELVGREPKELRERMQQVQQTVDELANMQEALCQRYAC